MLDSYKIAVCEEQGKLFELSATKGYDSIDFINKFMNSQTAALMDITGDHMQWAGRFYVMEELEDEIPEFQQTGKILDADTLDWIGYTYRYWCFCRNQKSKEIVQITDPKMMNRVYPMYHTLDCEMAVERCIEDYESWHKS